MSNKIRLFNELHLIIACIIMFAIITLLCALYESSRYKVQSLQVENNELWWNYLNSVYESNTCTSDLQAINLSNLGVDLSKKLPHTNPNKVNKATAEESK